MSKHALYRFYGDTGTLLYTGITNNPARRFTQHEESKEWWHSVRGITIDWYETRPDAEAAERRAIHVEQPRHNKVRPAPRPTTRRCGHCEECKSDAQCQNIDAHDSQCDCDDKTCWAYLSGYNEGLWKGWAEGCEAGESNAASRLAAYILDSKQHPKPWSASVATTVLYDLEEHNLTITPLNPTSREEATCGSEQSNQSSGDPQT